MLNIHTKTRTRGKDFKEMFHGLRVRKSRTFFLYRVTIRKGTMLLGHTVGTILNSPKAGELEK